MATEIVVPTLGESVSEATVAQWLKNVGDSVEQDEPIVELETDKVTLEVNASTNGVLSDIKVAQGESVEVGAILGEIGEGEGANDDKKSGKAEKPAARAEQKKEEPAEHPLSPAVRKLVEENDIDPNDIAGTGKDGRILKSDVQDYLDTAKPAAQPVEAKKPAPAPREPREEDARGEERVRMTRLRQRIAERLKDAQNTAAMLTTFNEIDMTNCMDTRAEYKERFEKRHGVRLGFMSFFAKAAIQALKDFPAVNAEIDGEDIVYKNYYDLGIAVSTKTGLVVPVVRDADKKSFADIEATITALGEKARDGKLSMEELTGGTFTITNGGVFGSLLSTPILNPPQSGILGMHKIEQRPVAVGGEVKIRPMMYVALSYDHRIVDGREAVSFLVRIKEAIEDPQRLLLEV